MRVKIGKINCPLTGDTFEFWTHEKETDMEEEFAVNSNLKLRKSGRYGIQLIADNGFIVHLDKSIKKLRVALQQFEETRTFIPPGRYRVTKITSNMFKITDSKHDNYNALKDVDGNPKTFNREITARKIAALLNEEEENE